MLLPLAVRPKLGSVAAVPVSKQTFVVQAGEEKPLLQDGWFDSGDVAVLEEDNIVRLTDRAKDVIKSGGEWISSIDMENLAMDVRAWLKPRSSAYPSEMGRTAVARCRATGRCDRDRTIDRGASGRQDRQMVDAQRCRIRRSA